MKESKNILENKILKNLALANAIGEINLFNNVGNGDSTEDYKDFRLALMVLENKGLIDVVFDKTDQLRIIRIKQIFH